MTNKDELECPHSNYEIEEVETNPDSVIVRRAYICSDCETWLDGDPDADRAEALADQQLMEMRGK